MEFKVEIILDPIKVIVQSEFQNAQMVVTQHQYSNQRIIFKYVKINQILLFVLIVGNADFIQINILFEFIFLPKVYGLCMPWMTKNRHSRESARILNAFNLNVINCSDYWESNRHAVWLTPLRSIYHDTTSLMALLSNNYSNKTWIHIVKYIKKMYRMRK